MVVFSLVSTLGTLFRLRYYYGIMEALVQKVIKTSVAIVFGVIVLYLLFGVAIELGAGEVFKIEVVFRLLISVVLVGLIASSILFSVLILNQAHESMG